MSTHSDPRLAARWAMVRRMTAVAASVLVVGGCGDPLKVHNPGSLQEEQLNDPALEQFLINGAIGEFQSAYANYALWSGVLADEVFTDHPNSGFRDLSLHSFDDGDGPDSTVYVGIHRALQSAEDATERLKKILGTKAATSLNVASGLIYAGYSYVLLGEGFCESPVNLSAPLSSDELLSRAVSHFDEAIEVATAAKGANLLGAQDLIYLAQLGAARASLKKGDLVKARGYAAPIPDSYERWAYYSANSVRQNNALQLGVRPGLPFLGMQEAFQNLSDARVPQPATPSPSLRANAILPPLKPSMYSGWTANTPAPIEVGTHIRFASGLEARYIGVEADGPNSAMLAFVNARRATGGKTAVSLSGSALLAEFRAQRALDFYLTGQRLGDLRRYAAGGVDLFPTGKFPVSADSYGAMHCFIVARSEKAGNPHY